VLLIRCTAQVPCVLEPFLLVKHREVTGHSWTTLTSLSGPPSHRVLVPHSQKLRGPFVRPPSIHRPSPAPRRPYQVSPAHRPRHCAIRIHLHRAPHRA